MAECLTKKRNYCVNEIYSQPVITTTSDMICLLSARDYHFIPNPPEYTDPDGKKPRYAKGVSEEFKTDFTKIIQHLNKSETSCNSTYSEDK